jgi:predicted amidohydrolase YtcJ
MKARSLPSPMEYFRQEGALVDTSTGNKTMVAFGTDWDVALLNPLEGIYAAITRRTLDDKNPNGWIPNEKIAVNEAVKCYTADGAFEGSQQDKLGQLKTNMLADFICFR